MRILSVAGANLASLRDPFQLDFDKPPLADAGLFVITGRTGSGKSTLLDAICLALYNRIPRLRNKKDLSNKVEDLPGGDLLSDNDPRQILRRGASEGYASVRFQGLDGKVYRSTWRVHRANKRVTGKLQESELTLINESDNHIELNGRNYKEEYTERIARLVGMNYEQFVRAVVLAQSQFDAFLKAPADEKATLLEQLTDTREFATISRTIFNRYTALKDEVERKGRDIDALGCFPPEKIAELQEAQQRHNETVERCKQTIERLTAVEAWHKEAQKIDQEVATAQTQVAKTEKEHASLAQERTWVDAWEESREVRQALTQRHETQKRLAEIVANLRTKSTDLQHTSQQLRQHQTTQRKLQEQKEALEIERVQLDHTQAACKEVETKLRTQDELRKRQEAKRQELTEQGKAAREEEKKQYKVLEALKTQIAERDALRERLAPHQALYEGVESMLQSLSSLTEVCQQIEVITKRLDTATAQREHLLQQQTALDEQWYKIAGSVPIEILQLRSQLREGEPCPLCGSTTHHLSPETSTSNALHWEALRPQQEQLKQQREEVEKALHDNELSIGKLRSTLELLEKQETQHYAALTVGEAALGKDASQSVSMTSGATGTSQSIPTALETDGSRCVPTLPITPEWLETTRVRLTTLKTERAQWRDIERQAGLDAQLETHARLCQNRAETTQRLRGEYIAVDSQLKETQTEISGLRNQFSELTHGQSLEHLAHDFQERFRKHDLQSSRLNTQLKEVSEQRERLAQTTYLLNHNRHELQMLLAKTQDDITTWLSQHPVYTPERLEELSTHTERDVRNTRERWEVSQQAITEALTLLKERTERHTAHLASRPIDTRTVEEIAQALEVERQALDEAQKQSTYATVMLEEQAQKALKRQALEKALTELDTQCREWEKLNALFGSKDGKRFRVIAQSYTLTALLEFANRQLARIMPRYRLERASSEASTLSLRIVDTQMGGEVRNIDTLSGGETFIVSLALSLALSSISSHHHAIELLFIDEGFGTLDADNLRLVLETLEGLQMEGRRIGLISHVAELNERIDVQVRVEKQGGDASRVTVVG